MDESALTCTALSIIGTVRRGWRKPFPALSIYIRQSLMLSKEAEDSVKKPVLI